MLYKYQSSILGKILISLHKTGGGGVQQSKLTLIEFSLYDMKNYQA